MTGSYAGVLAAADQQTAAIDHCHRLWPHNAGTINDAGVETAVLDRVAGPWQELRPGQVYLLWPSKPIPLAPGDDPSAVVRATAPALPGACDRCGGARHRPLGVLLVRHSPHLVALLICPACWVELTLAYEPRWLPL